MTYNVFSGTLNPTQSIILPECGKAEADKFVQNASRMRQIAYSFPKILWGNALCSLLYLHLRGMEGKGWEGRDFVFENVVTPL